MRLFRLYLLAAISALLACGAASALEKGVPRGGDITCKGPFSNRDTGRELLALYKGNARVEPTADITGEQFDGLFLFPNDRHARLALDERSGRGYDRLQEISLYERDSIWTIGGLRVGMTLAEVNKANGGPLNMSGIQQMTGTRFSIVAWIPDGDCTVSIVFDTPENAHFDHPLYGVEIKSDDPRLVPLNLRVDELGLTLPAPLDP